MKLLAIVVLYYPDENAFLNIGKYINDVDHLMIWDNTPEIGSLSKIKTSVCALYPPRCSKVHFVSTGKNEGLSYAYNRGIEYAKANGFTHMMTMDQDSEWVNFDKYKQFCEKLFFINDLSILGPQINDCSHDISYKISHMVINSGAIIPIEVYNIIGKYCERFLIDCVDEEYCYRAKNNKIPVIKIFGTGYIIQQFGNTEFFCFRHHKMLSLNYNPIRIFGILRNCILLSRIYPQNKFLKNYILSHYVKDFTISILFHENNKLNKILALYSGLIHGLLTKKSLDSKYSKA